jgi:hypothetical protein
LISAEIYGVNNFSWENFRVFGAEKEQCGKFCGGMEKLFYVEILRISGSWKLWALFIYDVIWEGEEMVW